MNSVLSIPSTNSNTSIIVSGSLDHSIKVWSINFNLENIIYDNYFEPNLIYLKDTQE